MYVTGVYILACFHSHAVKEKTRCIHMYMFPGFFCVCIGTSGLSISKLCGQVELF